MKKYIVFDLDWTLIDSHTDIKNNIMNYIKEKEPDFYDKLRYLIDFDKIATLKHLLLEVFENEEKALKHTKEIYKHINTLRWKTIFYKWIPEKIKELSKKYKLFLSTWSSTEFAEKTLEKWWIYKNFELIYWSDFILKWEEHLEIFADYSNDKNFYSNTISVWDWDMDKYFASQKNIDFIRIWQKWDLNEKRINSVSEIDKILSNFK